MVDDFDRSLWAYRAVFTQANAAGGSIWVNMTMRERTVILYGEIGADDYAADRAVTARIKGPSGNQVGFILNQPAVDNEEFVFPVSNHSALSASDGPQTEKRLVLGKGEIITFIAAALVQNETLTINIRALISAWPPAITTTGSGGTITTVTTYNKVI